MARTSSSKKKRVKKRKPTKGIRYIALKLKKYYPKRFPKFPDALKKARIIFDALKSENKRVTVVNIFSIERHHRKPKEEKPLIPPMLLDASPFFDLTLTPDNIENFLPTNLKVKSKLSSSSLPLLDGGVDNDEEQYAGYVYEQYFKTFVNWSNELAAVTQNQYPTYFCFTEPQFKNGEWITEIITCSEDGIKCDFGFDPDSAATPSQIFISDDYGNKKFNELRKLVKERGLETSKRPTTDELIKLLRKDDASKAPQPSPKSKKSAATEKEADSLKKTELEIKKIEAETKKIEAENEKRKLNIREQELDMEKIQYGLMTVKEFKAKWK